MRFALLLHAIVLAPGCGAYWCGSGLVASIESDFEPNCANIDKNVSAAFGLMIEGGIATKDEALEVFSRTHIRIRDLECLPSTRGSRCATGLTYGSEGLVELSSDGLSLAHEMMHRREADSEDPEDIANFAASNHVGWKQKHFDTQGKFRQVALNISAKSLLEGTK